MSDSLEGGFTCSTEKSKIILFSCFPSGLEEGEKLYPWFPLYHTASTSRQLYNLPSLFCSPLKSTTFCVIWVRIGTTLLKYEHTCAAHCLLAKLKHLQKFCRTLTASSTKTWGDRNVLSASDGAPGLYKWTFSFIQFCQANPRIRFCSDFKSY